MSKTTEPDIEPKEEPVKEITAPIELAVMTFNVLNSLTEIPKGSNALNMRQLGNGWEGLLRKAGVIKEG